MHSLYTHVQKYTTHVHHYTGPPRLQATLRTGPCWKVVHHSTRLPSYTTAPGQAVAHTPQQQAVAHTPQQQAALIHHSTRAGCCSYTTATDCPHTSQQQAALPTDRTRIRCQPWLPGPPQAVEAVTIQQVDSSSSSSDLAHHRSYAMSICHAMSWGFTLTLVHQR